MHMHITFWETPSWSSGMPSFGTCSLQLMKRKPRLILYPLSLSHLAITRTHLILPRTCAGNWGSGWSSTRASVKKHGQDKFEFRALSRKPGSRVAEWGQFGLWGLTTWHRGSAQQLNPWVRRAGQGLLYRLPQNSTGQGGEVSSDGGASHFYDLKKKKKSG